ncbi:K-box region and MADS-box transcription factor family protein [Striga asiatica]|uniref:K-box region and MADS-box transcription factor family protein n=1 Tax=Striga asiatica TaxID=4170 RepID=A0A5A7QSX8_STRAF|nr:K-box region and MADS-box transcription factor family protein [Striga asiatica]
MDYSKPRFRAAARAKPNAACKKHPKHRQSPGVCSLCLNEKLSNLADCRKSRARKTFRPSSSSSSDVSSLSSSNAYSSCSSPAGKSGTAADFRKSRSMAFAWRRRRDEEEIAGGKRGFWSRFLSVRRNNSNRNSKNCGGKGLVMLRSETSTGRVITSVY